jgi:group II intron reverse transcriptase/maturase
MRRKQKTEKSDCPCKDRLETENSMGVPSVARLETKENDGAEELLEKVLDRDNLNRAYKRVKQNGGAAGIDGMTVNEMLPYLKENREDFIQSIKAGEYKPQAVKRVEIPKPNGDVRKLGVPTVIDRMVQQAIIQVLQPIFEKVFSDSSYGFRPKRSAHGAIKQAKEYYEQGYRYVVDLDLAKYFDTVNHDMLINMVREEVGDEQVIKLIRKFLKSGIMEEGIISPSTEGTPQGGNLSPLLSNIYLNKFDKLLESRGHKFVRYADDCNIYVKSKRAAERVMQNCIKYLEGKLKLKVNMEKSRTGKPTQIKFLGFSLYQIKGKVGIRPHEKSIKRFKDQIRKITSRKRGRSIESILVELKRYTIGWLSYYSLADMSGKMKAFSNWIRCRIRMYIWKQWKKVKTRFNNLKRLGVEKSIAWMWANTRKGYWRIANSGILFTSLTNEYLASLGYDDISKRYKVLHSNY